MFSAPHIETSIESSMLVIGHRLTDLCVKLNVKHKFDSKTGMFYFDNKRIYGNKRLSGKAFVKPIYEQLYNEKLLI